MEGGSMDLNDRKRKILQAIIDEYIGTAEPVGSRAIVWVPFSGEQPKVKLSDNIRSLGVRDGYALYQVESGRYNFNSKL